MRSNRKYIAWVDHTSVAVGPTVQAVVAQARQIVCHPRWQNLGPGYPEIRVTTYGQQRYVTTATSELEDAR